MCQCGVSLDPASQSLLEPVLSPEAEAAASARRLSGIPLAFAILSVTLILTSFISSRTHSGLLGICGPYGDGWALSLELACLVLGGGAAAWVASRKWRRA